MTGIEYDVKLPSYISAHSEWKENKHMFYRRHKKNGPRNKYLRAGNYVQIYLPPNSFYVASQEIWRHYPVFIEGFGFGLYYF